MSGAPQLPAERQTHPPHSAPGEARQRAAECAPCFLCFGKDWVDDAGGGRRLRWRAWPRCIKRRMRVGSRPWSGFPVPAAGLSGLNHKMTIFAVGDSNQPARINHPTRSSCEPQLRGICATVAEKPLQAFVKTPRPCRRRIPEMAAEPRSAWGRTVNKMESGYSTQTASTYPSVGTDVDGRGL